MVLLAIVLALNVVAFFIREGAQRRYG
jgi:hypothetical protein